MMNNKPVQGVCRRCGKHVAVGELKLDPYYQLVVCPSCVRERLTKRARSH